MAQYCVVARERVKSFAFAPVVSCLVLAILDSALRLMRVEFSTAKSYNTITKI